MTQMPSRPRSNRSRLIGAFTALTVGAGALASGAAAAAPAPGSDGDGVSAAAAPTAGLVHHFRLDETSGTTFANSGSAGAAADATLVNPDKAELTGDGVRFNPESYESALDGAYVALPNDITAGMTEVTVDYDVWVDPANVGHHQMFSFGSKAGSCDAEDGAQGSIFASNTAGNRPGARFRVGVGNQNVQQNGIRLLEGAWKHVTYTQELNDDGTTWTGTIYLDGVQNAQVTDITTPPSVNAAGTSCNFLARSQNPGDYSFRGTISDFRVYDRAVSAEEAVALADELTSAGVVADAEAIDLGLTSAIVDDIVLPDFGPVAGSDITWTSSDPSVVSVYTPPAIATKVPVTGRITRPAIGQPDATATLTATVRKGTDDVVVRDIVVTVKAEFDDAQAADRDAFDLELHATESVRGNITLPDEGVFGSTITWESSSDLISPSGEVTRPPFGHASVPVTLTATITKGEASETKTFEATVEPLPRTEALERYFLGYFKGENQADGEQIMFATSNGNTALDWTGLTGGRPSLISQLGDQGLRDPHIVRSPDGDTFYMIATDLNWYDQGGYNINDTQYIEVFESNDLVNWTPQRHVKVAPDDAGNAFAPESLWVEEIGAYAVFWAQSLWSDPVNRTGQGNAQMWYNTTRDFQTFSEPQVWQDPAPLSRIDTTAIKVGDLYYRVTKNEAGNAGSDLFSEKHTDFLDSNIDNWELVAPALGRTTWQADAGYEGPVIFEANPGDTSCPGQFYLWGDRYTNGGGYQAACSEDIEAPTWNPMTITMTNAGVPRPRHGTVIPITLREWNDIRGIENSDVVTTTELSVEPDIDLAEEVTVSATVTAEDTFETGGQVRFSVGEWSETVYLDDGVAAVVLPANLAGGEQTLTAEYLGLDYLEASQDSAAVVITPGPTDPDPTETPTEPEPTQTPTDPEPTATPTDPTPTGTPTDPVPTDPSPTGTATAPAPGGGQGGGGDAPGGSDLPSTGADVTLGAAGAALLALCGLALALVARRARVTASTRAAFRS
ncbi:immunoglobulin-like domain-containing protein [Georgenia wangjunii]|uniref:immunoglobulin-like domain-containing protein n=1 Tax=Georgenia wangjunii TaxID=3117730 RepID=UPI002F26220F